MTNATFTRTELTAYETEQLHQTKLKVKENSLAVGAYVCRYGTDESLGKAAALLLDLLESLTADTNIRIGALEYGLAAATWAANDRNASQAYQLQNEFLKMIYAAAIAEKAGN